MSGLFSNSRNEESLHRSIRRATWDDHEALHHNGLLKKFADTTITIGEYRQLMARFHGYYVTRDPIVAGACDRFSTNAYSYVPRAPMFAADLDYLGDANDCSAREAANLRHRPLQSVADLAGVAYVIEGSMLGGTLLNRNAGGLLATPAGRSYWCWCERNAAERWALTRGFIEFVGANSSDREAIIASARSTFSTLRRWMSARSVDSPPSIEMGT